MGSSSSKIPVYTHSMSLVLLSRILVTMSGLSNYPIVLEMFKSMDYLEVLLPSMIDVTIALALCSPYLVCFQWHTVSHTPSLCRYCITIF